MLDNMRGSGNSKVMWVIMGLLMLGLTGFGIGGLSGGAIRSIGSVGDEPVEIAPYARGLQNAIAQANARAGRALNPAEIQETGLPQQVLDAVIGIAALNNEVTQKGISVGDETVRDAIVSNPGFRGINGSFDRESYEFFLDRQLGISAAEYESLLRKEAARSILETAVVGGVDGSPTSARTLLDFARQERSIEWAEVTADMLPTPVADPTDTELEAYYEENKAAYRTPETRRITYAWLTPDMLMDSVEISEEDLRAAYDDQPQRFNVPERRAVDRLVYPSMEAAEAAKAKLEDGSASFADLVTERGLGETDVSLGEIERGALSPAAAEAVFSATEPGVIGPVESALGPALFRLNAILAADSTPFEEARDELRTELAGEEARRMVNDLVTEIDDKLAAGATLEELAAETPMTVETIAFNAQSTDPITGYQAFREAALAAQEGDFPELVDLDDGGIFALRLDGIDPPADRPLEEIRDQVTEDWRAEQRLAAMREQASAFLRDITTGTEPEALIWNVEETVTRSSFIDDLPPSTVTQVFSLEKVGDIALIDGADRVYMVRLTDIRPYTEDSEGATEALEAVKGQRDNQIALDMLDLFSRAAQDRAQVTLNRPAINQVNQQIIGGAR